MPLSKANDQPVAAEMHRAVERPRDEAAAREARADLEAHRVAVQPAEAEAHANARTPPEI
jgi:hypothetical protein